MLKKTLLGPPLWGSDRLVWLWDGWTLGAHTCCWKKSNLFKYKGRKCCLDDVASTPCLWNLPALEIHPKGTTISQLPRKSCCSSTSSYVLFANKGDLPPPMYLEVETNLSFLIWTFCLPTQPLATPSAHPSALCFPGQTLTLTYTIEGFSCKSHFNTLNCLLLEFLKYVFVYVIVFFRILLRLPFPC